jgi:hypothetical protein
VIQNQKNELEEYKVQQEIVKQEQDTVIDGLRKEIQELKAE